MKKGETRKIHTTVFSVLFAVILIAADQWTKHLAVLHLKGAEPRILIDGMLEFRYLENRGAAFSMLEGKQVFFYVLTAVFLAIAIYVLARLPHTRRYLPVRICLLVLVAGAVGNLIDRIVQKYVVDFIYFSIIDFPVFNVADMYVTLSVTVLALLILFRYKDSDFAFLKRQNKGENEEE